MLKPKKAGMGLKIRTFQEDDGKTYLVFRSREGSFHVFAEVEAKEAAVRCGVTRGHRPPRALWAELWRRRA